MSVQEEPKMGPVRDEKGNLLITPGDPISWTSTRGKKGEEKTENFIGVIFEMFPVEGKKSSEQIKVNVIITDGPYKGTHREVII